MAIERALRTAHRWNIETGYGFEIAPDAAKSPVEVLKLHGRTNWFALMFRGMTTGHFAAGTNTLGDRPVLLARQDHEYLGYRDFEDPLCRGLSEAAALPALILPALPKVFHFETIFGTEWQLFWDTLWARAAQAISTTDELVIIGYSMPAIDKRARELLLGSANKTVRLTVCRGAKTKELENEFRKLGFTGVQHVAATFEEFIRL